MQNTAETVADYYFAIIVIVNNNFDLIRLDWQTLESAMGKDSTRRNETRLDSGSLASLQLVQFELATVCDSCSVCLCVLQGLFTVICMQNSSSVCRNFIKSNSSRLHVNNAIIFIFASAHNAFIEL